jgi:predicted enzyme related to lactoylglutathione lyase
LTNADRDPNAARRTRQIPRHRHHCTSRRKPCAEPPIDPAFEVDDLQAIIERLAKDGYGLVGGIGEYEHVWRMASVRGPEGIIVSLAERID